MASRIHALLLALTLPVTALLCPALDAANPATNTITGVLKMARSGKEVLLTWKLPEGDFSRMEIYRDSNPSTFGRGSVNTTRTKTTQLMDQVPELTVTNWYWLKLIRPDNTHLKIGPVATPEASVWQP